MTSSITTSRKHSTQSCKLTVVSGTYTLREEIYLATPPPHPLETPVVNNNPLATTPSPATAGTKLSVLSSWSKHPPLHSLKSTIFGTKGHEGNEPRVSGETEGLEDGSDADVGMTGPEIGTSRSIDGLARPSEKFGAGNTALMASMKDAKKKKPKNNISKNTSSFISRIIFSEPVSARLAKRSADEMFAFANVNRAFNWLDLAHQKKVTMFVIQLCHQSSLCGSKTPYPKSCSPRHIPYAMM